MATISGGQTLAFFKFGSSGLVALCNEVSDAFRRNDEFLKGVIEDSARYEMRDGDHYIVFDVDLDKRYADL